MAEKRFPFEFPPAPTDKKRIVFSFGVNDAEFFKCFPSDNFLGTRYDRNPCQFLIVWDIFLRPYHCEMQFYNPRNQLLLAFPVPKSGALPYTIVDGMVNEWVTKEEYVLVQFVFTNDCGEFVKSTIPIRMNLSPANKPNFMRTLKPLEFDRMKTLYDQAITTMVLRYDEVNGWVYDCFSQDGTLRFSLDWIPKNVVRATEQNLTVNEKMVARANINVPFTFTIPFTAADGLNVVKSTSDYVNELKDATFEVWKVVGEDTYYEVHPTEKGYNKTSVFFTLDEEISTGYIRVSCKSMRYLPSDDDVLLESVYSGNAMMDDDNIKLYTNGRLKE